MFKNSDNDSDTEAGHTCNGRAFKEIPLVNMFKQNYGNKGFYNGEEADLRDKEHSKSTREEEGKIEEPHRKQSKTSRNVQTVEVSTITPHVVLTTLSNHSNLSYQSTGTSGSMHTQSGNLGRSMADEMSLPTFRGDGSEDPD